jgi:peptide deformylase
MKLPIQAGNLDPAGREQTVEKIDDRIRELAANMLETMQGANGIARLQRREDLQLTVIDISKVGSAERDEVRRQRYRSKAAMPLILINPDITRMRKRSLELRAA